MTYDNDDPIYAILTLETSEGDISISDADVQAIMGSILLGD